MKRALYPVLCCLAGALLMYVCSSSPEPPAEVAIGTLVLTPAQIAAGRPDGERKGIEKITKAQAKPVVRSVAAGAARERIDAFAAAVSAPPDTSSSVTPDSTGSPENTGTAPGPGTATAALLCYARAEKFNGKRLEQWYDCSDGSERKQIVETGRKFEWIMEGDRADVVYDRLTALWDAVKLPFVALVGFLAGFTLF